MQVHPGLAALAAYTLVSFLYFGLRPLLDPGTQYIGPGADPQIFIWSFAWWPHAILHGQNPFITHAIWAPTGVNLTWTTSVPGLALIFSPLTLIFGAVASYNVAAVLMPALAAWTAFVLFRHLTRSFWPALVGGYLFGFSSYMLGQEQGHMHMTSVFLVPLVVLVLVRYLEGRLDRGGLVARLGPLLALQLLFSTELSLTLLLALGAAFLLALWLVPAKRQRLVSGLAPIAGAYALAAVLTAPFVYYALKGLHTAAYVPPEGYVADLLNFVVPTDLTFYGRGPLNTLANHFPGNTGERGAYVGLPALAIVALYALRNWRTSGARFLFAFFAVAAFFALGSELHIDGHGIVPLPWTVVDHWPLWDNALPVRFALYVSLAVGATVALWMASSPRGMLRWLLPLLAVIAIVPHFSSSHAWSTTYSVPSFFADGTYKGCLAPGENVLPLPIGQDGNPMLWQVKTGFRFRMAGGRIATTPPTEFMHPLTIQHVSTGYPIPATQAGLLAGYLKAKDVNAVVVDESRSKLWSGALDRLAKGQEIGGVLFYRISGALLACSG